MEKEELRQYAEKKVLEALSSAIESAYNDGYKAGYDDGVSGQESSVQKEVIDGVEYIDLNLPSGTKWSSGYLKDEHESMRFLSYDEADKLNIPTAEQFEELKKNCELVYRNFANNPYYEMVGTNTAAIRLYKGYRHEGSDIKMQDSFLFWLKDTRNENERTNYVDVATGVGNYQRNIFKGFKIPVMLVKKS